MSARDPREALVKNPFLVLGVPVTASLAELEREGQRLLDALALGMDAAAQYATPLGPRPRGAEEIREALAELRDPERRALHEVFAPPADLAPAASGLEPWPEALAALGWGRR